MTDDDNARKLDELDRLLNDPYVPMQPALIWRLVDEVSEHDLQNDSILSHRTAVSVKCVIKNKTVAARSVAPSGASPSGAQGDDLGQPTFSDRDGSLGGRQWGASRRALRLVKKFIALTRVALAAKSG